MKLYLASRYRDRRRLLHEVVPLLLKAGHTSTSRWLFGEGPPRVAACTDVEDVVRADGVLFFAHPGEGRGMGRSFELGMGIALGKRCCIIGPEPDVREFVFAHLPQVSIVPTIEQALAEIGPAYGNLPRAFEIGS